MKHPNFLYKSCLGYTDGLSGQDMLGKSVLCYGKGSKAKTETVGVPFLKHAIQSMESVVLCVSDMEAYSPALSEASDAGYSIVTASTDPIYSPLLSEKATVNRWVEFSDPLLSQLVDRPTILIFVQSDPHTVTNMDYLLLDLCTGDDSEHRVFLRRGVNILIDAPFYNFADFGTLMQCPGVRVCIIADSDIADHRMREMHSKHIRETPAGDAIWRCIKSADREDRALSGFDVLMKCTQVVICTGISGVPPQVHREFVRGYVCDRKLSGKFVVIEDLPDALPQDHPVSTDALLELDYADMPINQRMDAQLHIIEQTITRNKWIAMQDGAVKTMYFHGLYVPIAFYSPDSAYSWLYAYLRANRFDNAVYTSENRCGATISVPIGDGSITQIRIELIPNTDLDQLRIGALNEALELLEIDDALHTHPDDDIDGCAQLDRLEELLHEEDEQDEPVNTCPEEYRYVPYTPRDEQQNLSDATVYKPLPDSHVVFLGGHTNMVKKIRKIFPQWKYVFDDTTRYRTFDPNDIIFFWTAHASHKMMRYVFSRLPDTGNVRYVTATNIDLLIRQMEEQYNNSINAVE